MPTRIALVLALQVCLVATACAAGARVSHAAEDRRTPDQRGAVKRDIITAAELRSARGSTVHEALEHLRPSFLRLTRGPLLHGGRVVYLNGVRFGEMSELRTMAIAGVTQIELLSAGEATFRYGSGHPAGALLVTTYPRP